ncbi:hypothetical protein L596_028882 [Steinernema carpocapsae]|uniref:Tr-type G domain-containing protein n=1 Tax=Steinernema carpocapsae TaxID=34508 RepID=A0A4U5LZR6_STECR|nr:hypothetical protein L596_028882 [Steinernema carpocapsae]
MQRSRFLVSPLLRLQHLRRPTTLPAAISALHTTPAVYGKRQRKRTSLVEAIELKTKTKKRIVDIYTDTTIGELAMALEASTDEIADQLLEMDPKLLDKVGQGKKLENLALDLKEVVQIVASYDCKPRTVSRPRVIEEEDDAELEPLPDLSTLKCEPRPPCVTIMGHVDHGKTTLLDCLRSSRIVEGEFGGITQHIGAFSVSLKKSKKQVTFLDTPGHAAFGQMRSRGAQVTDIVVLVVAADDGVKEQTVESIKYAREAGVAIVVAINKCDRPNADPARAKRSLLAHDIVPEELGGDIQTIEISALHGKNVDALQEALLLQADLLDLKSTPKGPVEGVVVESTHVQGIGNVCTMIVQRGTLKKGSIVVAGDCWGRVKSMTDEFGKPLKQAGPSCPVRIAGWRDDLPSPGDQIRQVDSEQIAQKITAARKRRQMEEKAENDWSAIEAKREAEREVYVENRMKKLGRGFLYGSTLRMLVHKEKQFQKEGERTHPLLRIMIRSDVDGTLEAILNVIETYDSDDQCELQLVDFDVGAPDAKVVEMAAETNAIIYCFNTKIPPAVKQLANEKGVRIEPHNIIYRLVESVKNELSALIPDREELKQVGEGHVLKEFMITDRARKKQPVAGVLVDWGVFNKDHIFRIIRGSTTLYEGGIESMKAGTEVVTSAKTNTEVGLALQNKDVRFEEDDVVEVLEKVQVPQFVNWSPRGF